MPRPIRDFEAEPIKNSPPPGFTALVSDSRTPCGVEAFSRRLVAEAGDRAATLVLGSDAVRTILADRTSRAILISLPVVAWKRRLIEPILIALAARFRGHKIVVILHEWADLNWKRRMAYAPLLAVADSILFSCPEVEQQFGVMRAKYATRSIIPIPSNVSRPATTKRGRASDRIAGARQQNKLIVGQFGSIYPKKNPLLVLDVVADLVRRGADPYAVFIGAFIEGNDSIQQDFEHRVRRLGLGERVLVTGFIETEEELFGLFDDVDVFLYAFTDGLTARRSSVYACLSSGATVVANTPRSPTAFDHHPAYHDLLTSSQLHLVPCDSDARQLAEAVIKANANGRKPSYVDVRAAWRQALNVVDAATRP